MALSLHVCRALQQQIEIPAKEYSPPADKVGMKGNAHMIHRPRHSSLLHYVIMTAMMMIFGGLLAFV